MTPQRRRERPFRLPDWKWGTRPSLHNIQGIAFAIDSKHERNSNLADTSRGIRDKPNFILTFSYSMQGRVSIDSFTLDTCIRERAFGNGTTRAIRGLAEFATRSVFIDERRLCALASLSFAAD